MPISSPTLLRLPRRLRNSSRNSICSREMPQNRQESKVLRTTVEQPEQDSSETVIRPPQTGQDASNRFNLPSVRFWIPAFAGMTGGLSTVVTRIDSKGFVGFLSTKPAF